jgi:outer membrane immunogenic protein
MLRIRTLFLGAAALALTAAPVLAADLTYEQPPEPAPAAATGYNWTGPYVGATLGYGNAPFNSSNTLGDVNAGGVKGGLYGGYNFDLGNQVVVGAEVDGNLDGVHGNSSVGKANQKWDSTARGRVGYSIDRYLAYGTAGAAISGAKVKTSTGDDSATHLGWTVGAGVEGKLTDKVTARIEYQYADFGKKNYDLGVPGGTEVNFNTNTIRAGLGVNF